MSNNNKLNLIEIFRSVQGEGNEAGKITTFVRLGGCDFKCPWCDSKHTWNPGQNGEMLTVEEMFNKIESFACKHVTFTGGNPAIWVKPMEELVKLLKLNGYQLSMETQGSQYRTWMANIDNLVISPKNIPDSCKSVTDKEYKETIQRIIDLRDTFGRKTIIKTPIFNQDDLEWVKEFVNFDGKYEVYLSVGNDWIDMEDTVQFRTLILDRYKWIIEQVVADSWFVERKASVLPQVHCLVWDNKTGV